MALKQINLAFDAEQDRILMRISTSDDAEYRVWLTRRIIKALMPALGQVLAADATTVTSPEARQAVSQFKHEEAVSQARFSKDYEGADLKPAVGTEPLLVSRIQMRQTGPEQYLMVLAPQHGDAIQMKLGSVLMHGTVKLLRDTVALAQWDLEQQVQAPEESRSPGLVN